MNIYISMPDTERMATFITPRSLKMLQEQGNVTRNTLDRDLTAEELVLEAKDADVILCSWGTVTFTKELVAKLPNLKIIAYTAGSMSSVLESDTLDTGVLALTGNYIFAKSVAEGCIAYMLCSLRQIEKYMNLVRNGGWIGDIFYNKGLLGKKIGLVGFGEIAKQLVLLLKPFDVEILVNSGHLTEEVAESYGVKKATKEEIFSECDIVSLHLAMTEKTRGTIDRRLLSMLRPDSLLVNTARGGVIDQEAMTEMLQEKRFWAALDVFYPEPLEVDHPLRTLENTVVLPHMGGPTIDQREHIVMEFAKDFEAYKNGKPMKNQFNPADLSHMTVHGKTSK